MSKDRCVSCGESEAKCSRRGIWSGCCLACYERDRRTHLGTLPKRKKSDEA